MKARERWLLLFAALVPAVAVGVVLVWDAGPLANRQDGDRPKTGEIETPYSIVEPGGEESTDGQWGNWTAVAGAREVDANQFLRIKNFGSTRATLYVVNFTTDRFVGGSDASYSIPLDGNIRFAWWEEPSTGGGTPAGVALEFGEPSASGAVAVEFSRLGTVLYVTYRVDSIPDVLPDQRYFAPFEIVAV